VKRAIRIIILLALPLVVAGLSPGVRRRLFHPRGKLPPSVAECLKTTGQMTLYSIDPDRLEEHPPGTKFFHNFAVLGETPVTSLDTRRVVADTVLRAVSSWVGSYATCFEPRHGIRVANGSQTFDLLIGFHCQHIYSYEGDQKLNGTGLTGSQAPLDDILRSANVPLAKQPGE
jgi:hypothetical protein